MKRSIQKKQRQFIKKKKQIKHKRIAASSLLITVGQAARHCQVSLPGFKRWIRAGRLAAFRTPGGHYRIQVREFQRFLKQYGMPSYYSAGAAEIRILVVDDETEMVDLLVDFLAGDPRRFKLETATDGYEALIKVGAFKPSILILDVVMPRLDGIQVCRRLKAEPETRATKILGITGYPDAIPGLLEAGADACLAKPLDLLEVKRGLDRLLASLEA